ncbi:hypothetical protein VTN77DRAFT_1679 [Rasamsonia byssochlamydoides]|uniref:uncharacterized protein n=1 Tax=Rasamsonia byssochlamydoides TaxID=89139 RepID=UPI0037431B1D
MRLDASRLSDLPQGPSTNTGSPVQTPEPLCFKAPHSNRVWAMESFEGGAIAVQGLDSVFLPHNTGGPASSLAIKSNPQKAKTTSRTLA